MHLSCTSLGFLLCLRLLKLGRRMFNMGVVCPMGGVQNPNTGFFKVHNWAHMLPNARRYVAKEHVAG